MKNIVRTLWILALQGVLLTGPVLAAQVAAPFKSAQRFDIMGQLTGEILPDSDGQGPLKYPATRNTYDSVGRLIKVEQGELTVWMNETVAPRIGERHF